MPKFPHVEVDFSHQDGNALMIMGAVTKAMRRAGCTQEDIAAYREAAMSGDYDNVLRVTDETVSIL